MNTIQAIKIIKTIEGIDPSETIKRCFSSEEWIEDAKLLAQSQPELIEDWATINEHWLYKVNQFYRENEEKYMSRQWLFIFILAGHFYSDKNQAFDKNIAQKLKSMTQQETYSFWNDNKDEFYKKNRLACQLATEKAKNHPQRTSLLNHGIFNFPHDVPDELIVSEINGACRVPSLTTKWNVDSTVNPSQANSVRHFLWVLSASIEEIAEKYYKEVIEFDLKHQGGGVRYAYVYA